MKNEQFKQLYNALIAADKFNSKKILKSIFSESNEFCFIESAVSEVLEQIGSDWEDGELSLAQVYMSGVLCEELINDFMPEIKTVRKESPRIAGTVFLDNHSLGFNMVSSCIKASGYNILNLGSGLNEEIIIDCCIKNKIDLLMISVLMLSSAVKTEAMIMKLKKALPDICIAVGGAPFRINSSLWKKVGADYCGNNSSDSIRIIKEFLLEKKNG